MKNQGEDAGTKRVMLEQWLSDRYSPERLSGYLYTIGRYLEWIGGEEQALTSDYRQILGYLAHLRTLHLRPRTLKNYVFGVKIYHHFLRDTGRRLDHPCLRLRLRDAVDRGIRIDELYRPDELATLLDRGVSKLTGLTGRNRVIIGLLVHQALLVSEVVALCCGDVDLPAGTIYVSESVGNLARTLPLMAAQIMVIHDYVQNDRPHLLGDRPDPGQLILSRYGKPLDGHGISRLLNGPRYLQRGKRFLPLRIRQNVIAQELKSGHDLRVVQVFAGHRQISSTEAYQQTELEQLRAGIEKHHPLQ
jgi:integrase/recombinase XerD